MVISQRRNGVTYQYAAQSGELRITQASGERITGMFEFGGVLASTCQSTDGKTSCAVHPNLRGPLLEGTGTFDAIPES